MLVGRDRELRYLHDRLTARRPVIVVGEPGVGKTTVMREAAARTSSRVAEGGALSTLAHMPYLAIERLLGRRLPRADPSWVAAEAERHVGDGVAVVDDVQWADGATLECVATLGARVPVLAAARPADPGSDAALGVLIPAGFDRLDLEPLDEEDGGELIRLRRPDMTPTGVERLLSRSGGNPLLIEQLAATDEPSETLRLSVVARLRNLGPDALRGLELLSLAGRPLRSDVVGSGWAELERAGFVTAMADQIAIRHALIGEVVAEALDDEARALLHATLAAIVGDEGASAWHHAQAGNDELAHEKAMRAAEVADRPEERAAHLAIAASCASGDEADTLRLDAAKALQEAARYADSNAILDRVSSRDAQTLTLAAALRARNLYQLGHLTEAREVVERTREFVPVEADASVELLVEDARLAILLGEGRDVSLDKADRAWRLAERTGRVLARARYVFGTALSLHGGEGASEHLLEAARLARESGDADVEFRAMSNYVQTLEFSQGIAKARAVVSELVERARELRLLEWERTFQGDIVNYLHTDGAYADAAERGLELLDFVRDARTRSFLYAVVCSSLVNLGRTEEALSLIERALPEAPDDWMGRTRLLTYRAQALLFAGRAREALSVIDECLGSLHFDHGSEPAARAVRAWICFELEIDPGPPFDTPHRGTSAVALETHAIKAFYEERFEAAATFFDDAVAVAGTNASFSARSLWGAGEALRALGRTEEAMDRLRQAEAVAVKHRMVPQLARVHRSMRLLGERRSAQRRGGGADLTARQREILALVGVGLTNTDIAQRLGLSNSTVARQISSAMVKLGASTRGQAAALAAVE